MMRIIVSTLSVMLPVTISFRKSILCGNANSPSLTLSGDSLRPVTLACLAEFYKNTELSTDFFPSPKPIRFLGSDKPV